MCVIHWMLFLANGQRNKNLHSLSLSLHNFSLFTNLVMNILCLIILTQIQLLGEIGVEGLEVSSASFDSKEEQVALYNRLAQYDPTSDHLKFIYCTPERIVNSKHMLSKLEKLYSKGFLKLIVIDESHCCSTWVSVL